MSLHIELYKYLQICILNLTKYLKVCLTKIIIDLFANYHYNDYDKQIIWDML